MWIISKKYGAFNTENLTAIQRPDPESDWKAVRGFDSGRSYHITDGDDNYQKIVAALANNDSIVEVP